VEIVVVVVVVDDDIENLVVHVSLGEEDVLVR